MLVGSQPRRVAVIGGARIPFARAHGAYASVGNQEMLTASLKAVVDKYGLKGVRLGDVVAGAVMKHSSQWNLARESLLDSGLSPETPGLDVQRACGTSIEAAIVVANKVALGQIDAGIAGGVDTVSDPPIVFGKGYQQILLRAHAAKSSARGSRPSSACGRATSSRTSPASASRAPACRWASTRNRWRAPGRSRARTRTRSRSRATRTRAAPGPRASWRTSSCPTSGSRPTTTCARTRASRSSRSSSPRSRRTAR